MEAEDTRTTPARLELATITDIGAKYAQGISSRGIVQVRKVPPGYVGKRVIVSYKDNGSLVTTGDFETSIVPTGFRSAEPGEYVYGGVWHGSRKWTPNLGQISRVFPQNRIGYAIFFDRVFKHHTFSQKNSLTTKYTINGAGYSINMKETDVDIANALRLIREGACSPMFITRSEEALEFILHGAKARGAQLIVLERARHQI